MNGDGTTYQVTNRFPLMAKFRKDIFGAPPSPRGVLKDLSIVSYGDYTRFVARWPHSDD